MSTLSMKTILSSGVAARSGNGGGSKLSVSIVYNHNGKRVKFSSSLLKELGKPKTIQVLFDKAGNCMYLAEKFAEKQDSFHFAPSDPQIVYGSLPSDIVKTFGLDYSEITSKSYPATVKVCEEGYPVAIVSFA